MLQASAAQGVCTGQVQGSRNLPFLIVSSFVGTIHWVQLRVMESTDNVNVDQPSGAYNEMEVVQNRSGDMTRRYYRKQMCLGGKF